MASYGLEAVNESLEEAASQLSLDFLREHKNTPYSLNFSRVRCICQEFICLTTNSLWKIDDVSASSFSLAYQDIICNIMTIRKFYCTSALICPIRKTYRSIFWNAENRQATDGYDDSEFNSRMLREGSYRFSLDSEKHTLCT